MAEQEEQQEYRRRPLKLQKAFTHYTSERSNQSAKYQEGVTSFDCTATLPSVDQALHRSAKAMPLSATSLPGIQRHLPTQQLAAQTQPTAPSLPAIPSTVASPATSQLSQQAYQHLATSPHSGHLKNPPMQQIHL